MNALFGENAIQWSGDLDSSCPKFAFDEDFVSILMARGGMPRFALDGTDRVIGPDGKSWREVRS